MVEQTIQERVAAGTTRPGRRRLHWPRGLPVIPALILVTVLFLAVFGDLIAPHDHSKFNLYNTFEEPFFITDETREAKGLSRFTFILGTDNKGHDILSQLIAGARASVIVALTVLALAGTVGTALGLVSGYFGGWVDTLIMRLVDIKLSIPAILLALIIVAAMGPGFYQVIVVIALTSWTSYARLIRGEVLALRTADYVALAKTAGAGTPRILTKHIFPQILNTLLILATLQLGIVLLFEAALSFLGLGVQPPDVSWGLMISNGRQFLVRAPWVAAFPGIAITLTVLSSNLLGDWLRDTFDPRLRQV